MTCPGLLTSLILKDGFSLIDSVVPGAKLMRHLPVLVVLLLAGQTVLAADKPPAKAEPATIDQLITQLSSRDFRVREAASLALAERDLAALPALLKARQQGDPEVRRRLDELIPVLERKAALTPKRITLHMTSRPLKDAFAELTRQTGYKIESWPNGARFNDNDRTVYTFHMNKVTFWEAMDQLCSAGGMILQQNYWGDESLRVYAQDSYVPFSCNNGPFRVVATGFTYGRNNQFGQIARNPGAYVANGGNEYLQLGLTIMVEPKLPILRAGQVRVVTAEDEERHSMVPPQNSQSGEANYRRYYGGGGFRSYVHSIQASFSMPSKNARTMKYLQGTIPVTLLSEQKPSLVTDRFLTSKGKKVKIGGTTFHITDVTEQPGKQYQFSISVSEENKGNSNDYTQAQTLQQRLEVQDDKGNKRPMFASSMSYSGPGNAQIQFTLQPAPPGVGNPARIVYYAWETLEHEVEFEFRDLPLP